jgi:excisionase family DNA binding protein
MAVPSTAFFILRNRGELKQMQIVQDSGSSAEARVTSITNGFVEAPIDCKAAAAFLGVHPKTVGKYAREGRIPAHRVGSKILRFYESELDNWLRSKLLSGSQSVPRELKEIA